MKGGPRRAACVLVAVLALASLLARDAWPPDETRYADVARAMLAGEGAVVPHLHGALYGEKPPVFFWLTAAVSATGVPLGAAPRAVSALAALVTLALLPGIGRRLGLADASAERAPLLLATSPLFLAYALAGLLDATSTALVTGAIAAHLARACAAPGRRVVLAAAEGALLAAALLTKGPVLLLFPLGLRAGAMLGARRPARTALAAPHGARALLRAPATPEWLDLVALGVAVALAGAWLLAAAHVAGTEYVRSITLGQAVRRVSGDAPHLRPPGFLLLVTLVGLLPWTPFVIRALWDGLRGPRASGASAEASRTLGTALDAPPEGTHAPGHASTSAEPALFALAGWLLVPLLLLSFLRTQQPHYGLPGLPAAALLAAVALEGARERVRARVPRLAAAVALLAAASLPAVAFLDREQSPRAILAVPSVAAASKLDAPGSVRSAVRVLGGRVEVDELSEHHVVQRLRADPDRVALVWARDLARIGEREGIEEIARGHARGREIVALRARHDAPAVSLPPASP